VTPFKGTAYCQRRQWNWHTYVFDSLSHTCKHMLDSIFIFEFQFDLKLFFWTDFELQSQFIELIVNKFEFEFEFRLFGEKLVK
jgi:hypothetical protein